MPIVEIQRIAGTPKERVDLKVGSFFYSDFLVHREDLSRDVLVTVNGVELGLDDELDFEITPTHFIQVFDQPKGVIGDILNPVFNLVTKVFSFLAPKTPSFSAAESNVKDSPNNRLTGQTNVARAYQARPEIHGQVRAFPDLIQQSMFEYNNNLKTVTEWLNIGIGEYKTESIRFAESDFTAMAGASYKIYKPKEVIPLINEGFEFPDIDGQELPGPNESKDIPQQTATANEVVSGEIKGGEAAIKIVKQDEFEYFYELTKPRSISMTVNVSYDTPQGSVTKDVKIDAQLVDAKESDDSSLINPVEYYEFFFTNLTGTDLAQLPPNAVVNTTKFILYDNQFLTVGPFFSPVDGDQMWIHLQAQLGGGDNCNATVEIWKINTDNEEIADTRQSFNTTLSANNGARVYYKTDKVTLNSGRGRYAVQLTRRNNSSDQSIMKIENAHIVRVRENVVFDNDTIVNVSVRATEAPTGARERKYNLLATRMHISYDRVSKQVDYTLRPSRSFADAVLHTWLITAGESENNIDIDGLYRINDSLPDERLGYFDYTFDDEDISLGQRIETICNAARVTAYFDNAVLTFSREQSSEFPMTTFNRSNITGNDMKISYDMSMPSGYDGIELEHVEPVRNKKDYIRFRVDENGITEGLSRTPNKIVLQGCRNRYQALDRALLEANRLIHQRTSISLTTLADGGNVYPSDMVLIADTYDSNQQAGYITERNGEAFTTSEKIKFDDEMWVYLTDSMGYTTQKFKAEPRQDTEFGFTASVPEDIELNLYDGYRVQSPSRYVIATSVELENIKWVITDKRPLGGERYTITATEYFDAKADYNA
ncbi:MULTISPECIES: host specificity factor TipJ family phage tail protein [Providencia]|uniref:host specificity factor TipJ family phage tail protein n=1 Tax=Providencia TaxID=586 RepID=UPI00141A0B23|nr:MULTISPECIES: host specificity factor TipJ family phage tail protein [Providencia]NIA45624.1 MoaD/ThiS family protein [Providencia rettgeri]NIA99203.1 MoaD/ThiS family protein [Providencia rettgeri]NIB16995.1 MoaD/ThiS family protein [Providencia rettgeri]NIB36914.1 MoaD/ThiS family protein [Providencia rettgeri]NIL73007.1 MoaD/ThiS family protein [Providencia sp. 504mA]